MDNLVELFEENQEKTKTGLRSLFRGAVKAVLESVLEEEVIALCGARKGERTPGRKDFRNGSYLRQMLTSLGHIDVAVPRTRESGNGSAEILGRYKRRTEDMDALICESYVHGVSTRDMSELMEALCGRPVGKSTVSRVTKVLEEHVESLSKAPIEDDIPYLFLDATFINTRWARAVENVSALVAYGVSRKTGKRTLLAVTMGVTESEDSWTELLEQLIGRGIKGVKLVVADAHQGLSNAVRKLFPDVKQQRCTVHFMRNMLAKSPRRLQKRLANELKLIFKAKTLKEAKAIKKSFVARWHKELPELVACLEKGFTAATHFYAFPQKHHKKIRTTNGIERLHLEIKRRTKVIGSFPDRKSALRLITAVAINHAKNWEGRAYLDMSLLGDEVNQETMEKKAA